MLFFHTYVKLNIESSDKMRKGFTLIELLAVIVILAIIALITIPAVLRMTDNAKVSSYRRSIDLYGRAINTAIAAYKSDKIEKKEPYQVTFSNVEAYVDYEGNDINCKESKIYSDDTILLTECSVDGNLVYAEKNKGYGSNNYYYYTNATKRIRILEYVNGVNKALKGKEFTGNTCEVQSNGNLLCNGETIEVISNLEKPINGTLTISNNEVISYSQLKFEDKKIETVEEIPTVIDEGEINTGGNSNTPTPQENIASETEDYRGYYADVDGDGNADGVIYADLAHSKSGDFYNDKMGWGQGDGTYSYEAKTNLNEYTVSNNTYKKNDGFGENKIIKLKKDKNNPRFYVMALNDFTEGSMAGNNIGRYYWYKNAYGKMDTSDTSPEFGTGYTNTGNIIRIWNAGESGKYNAGQNEYDIWGKIQSEYAKGWYIPSRGEWGAFGDYFKKRTENKLTHDYKSGSYVSGSGNYNSLYGLSSWYWSSSQGTTDRAWNVNFIIGFMGNYSVNNNYYVRLGVTF